MSQPNKLRVMVETNPEIDPFSWCPVRELARRTGQDASNLSKYRAGKLVMNKRLYDALLDAAYAYGDEVLSHMPARPRP